MLTLKLIFWFIRKPEVLFVYLFLFTFLGYQQQTTSFLFTFIHPCSSFLCRLPKPRGPSFTSFCGNVLSVCCNILGFLIRASFAWYDLSWVKIWWLWMKLLSVKTKLQPSENLFHNVFWCFFYPLNSKQITHLTLLRLYNMFIFYLLRILSKNFSLMASSFYLLPCFLSQK